MRNCAACHRPVKNHDGTCPFCAAAMPPAPDLGAVTRLAIGSAIILAAGCAAAPKHGGSPEPSPSTAPSTSPLPVPPYGVVPPPSAPPN